MSKVIIVSCSPTVSQTVNLVEHVFASWNTHSIETVQMPSRNELRHLIQSTSADHLVIYLIGNTRIVPLYRAIRDIQPLSNYEAVLKTADFQFYRATEFRTDLAANASKRITVLCDLNDPINWIKTATFAHDGVHGQTVECDTPDARIQYVAAYTHWPTKTMVPTMGRTEYTPMSVALKNVDHVPRSLYELVMQLNAAYRAIYTDLVDKKCYEKLDAMVFSCEQNVTHSKFLTS